MDGIETKEGLKQISDILEYVQNIRGWSGQETARQTKTAGGGEVGGNILRRIHRAPLTYPYHEKYTIESLSKLCGILWIPLTELPDSVTGELLGPLPLHPIEAQAILQGRVRVRVSNDQRLGPFSEAIEAVRTKRHHSYKDMLQFCNIKAQYVDRVRRLLALNGFSIHPGEVTEDIAALTRYIRREDQNESFEDAFERLVDLHLKSFKCIRLKHPLPQLAIA